MRISEMRAPRQLTREPLFHDEGFDLAPTVEDVPGDRLSLCGTSGAQTGMSIPDDDDRPAHRTQPA